MGESAKFFSFVFEAELLLVLPTFLVQMTWRVFNFIQRKVHFADHLTIDWRNKINILFYYINTSEIPSELHIFTSYIHMWRDYHHFGYIINPTFFTQSGVNIINRILHVRLWIWILSSRVQLVRYRVEHEKIKFIHVWACNILYIFNLGLVTFGGEVEVAWGWAHYFWEGCYFLGSLHVLFGFTRGNVFWCYFWGRGVTTLRGSLLLEVYSMWIISIGGSTWQCIITAE